MPNIGQPIFPSRISPTLGAGGGTPTVNNGLLQETGGTNFFELESGTGVLLLES